MQTDNGSDYTYIVLRVNCHLGQELSEAIRTNEWHSMEKIMKAATERRGEDPSLYNAVLHQGPDKMAAFLAWMWALEDVGRMTANRVDLLREAAINSTCTCEGRWIDAAEWLMNLQGINSTFFRQLILRALAYGRNNVLVHGEPDAGKTFYFKPLQKIFGDRCFVRRGQGERRRAQQETKA